MAEMRGRRLHFIAIGGAGMSGLALVCKQLGAEVTGSDRAESSYTGAPPRRRHRPAVRARRRHVPPDAEVVVSTAIPEDNPELARARERGQRVIHRGELLAELCAQRRLLAIAGTHGKTTTTAMCIWALREIGADPAFFLGGELPGAGPAGEPANAGWGEGEWVVAEADESDASFLKLRPEVAVVTNLELDHHSRWGSLAELSEAFAAFASSASGLVCGADVSFPAERANASCASPWSRPGMRRRPEAELIASGIRAEPGGRQPLPCTGRGVDTEVTLRVPGRHNVANALAALGGLALAGFDVGPAPTALAGFPGVARRLELKGERNGARIYDDYAHHPTEVCGDDRGGARARAAAPDRRLPAAPLLAHQGARDRARRGAGRRGRGRGSRRLSGARGARRPARRGQRPDGRRAQRRTTPGAAASGGCRPPSTPPRRSRRGWARATS